MLCLSTLSHTIRQGAACLAAVLLLLPAPRVNADYTELAQCGVIPGDIVEDGSVNVQDVVSIVAGVLESIPLSTVSVCQPCYQALTGDGPLIQTPDDPCYVRAGDVNADDKVDVLDVVTLVAFILGDVSSPFMLQDSACEACFDATVVDCGSLVAPYGSCPDACGPDFEPCDLDEEFTYGGWCFSSAPVSTCQGFEYPPPSGDGYFPESDVAGTWLGVALAAGGSAVMGAYAADEDSLSWMTGFHHGPGGELAYSTGGMGAIDGSEPHKEALLDPDESLFNTAVSPHYILRRDRPIYCDSDGGCGAMAAVSPWEGTVDADAGLPVTGVLFTDAQWYAVGHYEEVNDLVPGFGYTRQNVIAAGRMLTQTPDGGWTQGTHPIIEICSWYSQSDPFEWLACGGWPLPACPTENAASCESYTVDCAPGLHQYCEEENYPVAIAIYDGRPVVISNRRTDMYGNLDYYGDGKGTWNVMIQRKVTLDDGSQVFTSQYDGGWTDLDPTTVNQGGLQASLGSESSKAVRAAGVFGDDPQWLVIVGASGLLWTRNLNTDYFSDGSGNQGILNTGNIEAIDGFEHFDVTDWRGVTEFMGRVFVVGEYEHEGQMHWAIAHAPINAVLWDESSWRVYDDIFSYDADSALTYPMVDIVGTDSFLQLHYEQRTLPFASWMKVLRWTP